MHPVVESPAAGVPVERARHYNKGRPAKKDNGPFHGGTSRCGEAGSLNGRQRFSFKWRSAIHPFLPSWVRTAYIHPRF